MSYWCNIHIVWGLKYWYWSNIHVDWCLTQYSMSILLSTIFTLTRYWYWFHCLITTFTLIFILISTLKSDVNNDVVAWYSLIGRHLFHWSAVMILMILKIVLMLISSHEINEGPMMIQILTCQTQGWKLFENWTPPTPTHPPTQARSNEKECPHQQKKDIQEIIGGWGIPPWHGFYRAGNEPAELYKIRWESESGKNPSLSCW